MSGLHFTNPWALWALLAVPIILLIHCLQERARKVTISTLFLLEHVAPENVTGARFEKLRTSLPLWLQLLAACLIAWMLSEPRWMKADSTQTVVVLLDSSASMGAFADKAKPELATVLGRWAGSAARTEWHLLETDVRKPRLYTGTELPKLLESLAGWQPLRGEHGFEESLSVARGLLREGSGAILLLSDHEQKVPVDVALLTVGEARENVGFVGVETRLERDATRWSAVLMNHGKEAQLREWWLEQPSEQTPAQRQTVSLEPGKSATLSGELPPQVQQAMLRLSGDALAIDDTMPIQQPKSLPLTLSKRSGTASAELVMKMLEVLPNLALSNAAAQVEVAEVGTAVTGSAVLLGAAVGAQEKMDGTVTLAENHALTRELNWSGLLTQKPPLVKLTPEDTPLLWKGDAPLAWLHRVNKQAEHLVLNWDVERSNARRLPAVLILLQRFMDRQREQMTGERWGHYELGQPLRLPATQTPLQLTMDGKAEPYLGRVPQRVGFFTVGDEKTMLVRGAAYFADAREANLQGCGSRDDTGKMRLETAMRNTEADPLTPLWMLLVLGCLLGAWGSTQSGATGSMRRAL
jgi:hypothetical protein